MSETVERTWVTSVARRHTPLFLSIAVAGQARERIELNAGLNMGFGHQRRHGLAYQFEQHELEVGRSVVAAAVERDGLEFFDTYSRRCSTTCDALLAAGSARPREPLSLRAELERYFDAAVSHAAQLLVVILVQFELEAFVERFVAARIENKEQRSRVIASLKVPSARTNEVKNLEALLRLGAQVQAQGIESERWANGDPAEVIAEIAAEHPAIWDSIEQFQEDFGWMGRMYYSGHPISVADIVLRLQNMLAHDCGERLRRLEADRVEQAHERDRAIRELGGDRDATLLADLIGRYLHLRSYRLDVFFIAHERRLDLMMAAAEQLGLDYEGLLYLDWREVLDGLSARRAKDDVARLSASRRDGFAMLTVDGRTTWTSSDWAHGLQELVPVARPAVLRGVTACAGRYEGRVRVLLADHDMLDMEPGEVLVTTMTTPSLMLAVEKASAIVTDEGGMLCHAAIVSREFGIPCIIGTEHATRWLKTGDRVVVDATAAAVHIRPAE